MILAAALALLLQPGELGVQRLDLGGTWRVTQADRKIDLPGRVPGSVHTDLLAAKAIPDPFYRDNEKLVQWVGEVPWTYSRTFDVPLITLRRQHIVLRCEGLDTLATIRLNGHEVAKTGNLFRTWEFDAKPFLEAGKNRIEIRFDPVGPVLKAKENQAKFPGKPAWGQGYVRKTPVQNGWDFAPTLLTCGIPRPISLVSWQHARINDVRIGQSHRAGKVALDLEADAEALPGVLTETIVSLRGKEVARKLGNRFSLEIPKPQLWWPAGMGAQPLYEVKTVLRDAKGQVFDEQRHRVGLRTIVWKPKTPQGPLTMTINDRPFFVKGANWIPPDALNARVNADKYRRLMRMAKDANMNMIRFWGGGLYEDDALYDLCDEMGLLVWFEFKFACTPYPAFDPEWVEDVRCEAVDNVKRLRNHPSIAIWSGNNEVAGFVDEKSSLFKMSREDYATLFHKTLANVVKELVPDAHYTPGSPESGDDHNWTVWHGGAPFETYLEDHGFMSEFGFQSFPEPRSIASVTAPEDRISLLSPILKYRQRNIGGRGNENIADTIERYFRKPKDFDSALWLSQINQAMGIVMGVEGWRRDWPRSSGSLVWQFDDNWPTPSWSMIDYYERPKALYYRLKEAYEPLHLSGIVNEEGQGELWIANDLPTAWQGRLEVIATRADGTPIDRSNRPASIGPGTKSGRVATIDLNPYLSKVGRDDLLLWAAITQKGKVVSRTLVTLVRPKSLRLTDPEIQTKVVKTKDGQFVTLTAKRAALWTWIEAGDAKLSDNVIHLRPGEPRTIHVLDPGANIRVRSLYDTFDPRTPLPDLTLKSAPDGAIHADAAHADLIGGLVLERNEPPNLGNWSRVRDAAEWRVSNLKAGRYELSVDLASPEGGSRFAVTVGKERREATVPRTGDWTKYETLNLGPIDLVGGPTRIVIQAIEKRGSHVMNLRAVHLVPGFR